MIRPDQANVVGPEDVARQCPNLSDDSGDGGRRPWGARIIGMADDTNDAVFSQRAGGPALASLGFKPAVRGLMTHMSRINEGDHDVDIKQECHSDSSRSAFTA